jgi:hypothetical protein
MGNRSAKEISEELNRLMLEQIESLKNEIFLRLTPEELRRQRERIQRIREVFRLSCGFKERWIITLGTLQIALPEGCAADPDGPTTQG